MHRTPEIFVVADMFPPVAAVGVHRAVALCRQLVCEGWRVTVLTARAGENTPLDETLLDGVPEGVRVVRTRRPEPIKALARILRAGEARPADPPVGSKPAAGGPAHKPATNGLVDWATWWLHVPDGAATWFGPAVVSAIAQARRHRPSAIFSTAPMWTSHLVALVASRFMHVPWVADFRDPWCGSQWREIPFATHRMLDEYLERTVVRNATRVTCAWDGIRKHLAGRYPQHASKMTTILNGFDPEQIDAVEPEVVDADRCVLLHAGEFYGPRSPVGLLRGLKRLKARDGQGASRLLVVLLGPPEFRGRPLEQLAAQHGVSDMVRVIPAVSHRQALAFVKGCDVAMLFGQSGSCGLASVPAKAYEYVGAGKAVLAIGAREEACSILRDAGCRLWAVRDDEADIADALADIARLRARTDLRRQTNHKARLPFARAHTATALARTLRSAIASRHNGLRRTIYRLASTAGR